MRVTNETAYRSLLRDLERISERMQETQLQISSGKKLHKPSDDPTAVSDVVRIRAEHSEIAQYQDNVATAKSRLGIADTTLQSVETMIERVRSLALLSMSNVATAHVQTTEIAGLRGQLVAAANTTFDGQFIFAGSNVDGPAYTEASDGTVSYTGNDDEVRLQIGRSATLQMQVPGSEIFSGAVDLFATIKDLVDAMNAGNKSGISAQVAKLEQFSSVVGGALGKVGGLVNVAQSVQSDLTQYELARTEDLMKLEDVDLSVALTDFTQAETALRAATAVGARISNISILDYLN
jgi:flagellar hook-associated protein 3 FlgL